MPLEKSYHRAPPTSPNLVTTFTCLWSHDSTLNLDENLRKNKLCYWRGYRKKLNWGKSTIMDFNLTNPDLAQTMNQRWKNLCHLINWKYLNSLQLNNIAGKNTLPWQTNWSWKVIQDNLYLPTACKSSRWVCWWFIWDRLGSSSSRNTILGTGLLSQISYCIIDRIHAALTIRKHYLYS